MERLDRFIKAVEYLKRKADGTNEGVSRLLRYNSENYISDVIGKSKPINKPLLKRMVEYSINPEWVWDGEGEMILEPTSKDITKSIDSELYIEFKTAKGKMIRFSPKQSTEYVILNALLEERDSVLEERNRVIEKIEIEKQARIDELIKEKENLNNIINQFLTDLKSNSEEMAEDIEALTTEIQAEHRAMMDSIDVAAGLPIGTTFAKSDTVEIASEQVHLNKGKKTGIDKKSQLGKKG